MVVEIKSNGELKEKLAAAGDKLVVLDFYATWCGPCKQIAPKVEELSKELTNVVFYKIDVDECEEIAVEYNITSMPTFVMIKNGKVLESFVGANVTRLTNTIAQYK